MILNKRQTALIWDVASPTDKWYHNQWVPITLTATRQTPATLLSPHLVTLTQPTLMVAPSSVPGEPGPGGCLPPMINAEFK